MRTMTRKQDPDHCFRATSVLVFIIDFWKVNLRVCRHKSMSLVLRFACLTWNIAHVDHFFPISVIIPTITAFDGFDVAAAWIVKFHCICIENIISTLTLISLLTWGLRFHDNLFFTDGNGNIIFQSVAFNMNFSCSCGDAVNIALRIYRCDFFIIRIIV